MKYNKLKKLIILCGGTGGHFYPGLTIARELQKANSEAYIIIGGHKEKISKQADIANKYNIKYYTINSSKFSKKPLLLGKFIFNLSVGFLKARKMLKRIKPNAVLGMGSFTSLPVSLAAISLNIPIYLHDGNAKIGKANVFLSNWARLTMSAFPAVNEKVLKSDYLCTGMPIRPEIREIVQTKEEAIKELNSQYDLNFKPKNKTIFIFGGSQGALTINRILPLTIERIKDPKIQIIHLFGKNIKINPYEKSVDNSLILKSCDKMHLLYSAADLIVSRSGGSTIAELAYFKKKSILIPYPFASELHQNDNANFYIKKSNSTVVLNKNCNIDTMKPLIESKLYNEEAEFDKSIYIKNAEKNILSAIDKNISCEEDGLT
jgi:UDP-N-acetylglucosamine--N-acetylmuramyl-(pentapeptide) pyrophosphoryl-undecaprenol N-acetylglucosamine transferase